MLLRLLPDQVAERWDEFKEGIEASLPPIAGESPDKMNNILSAILVGRMVCWASYRKVDDDIYINGLVITNVIVDECTMTKHLLIYVIYSPPGIEIGHDGWIEGFAALVEYAKSVGCSRIVGYSTSDHIIIPIVKKLGGNADIRFIYCDI